MEQKTLLKRSSKGLQVQVLTLGIMALVLSLLATWLLGVLFSVTPFQGTLLKIAVWIVLVGGWAITSIKMWTDWSVKRYEIAQDAFIVHAKAGRWGRSQTIYRYESIISLRMTQGFLGKRYGYGDVHIKIPKLDDDVVMNDIDHPLEQLAEVQRRIGERQTNPATLIT